MDNTEKVFENAIDYKKIFQKLLGYKKQYIFFIILFLAIAFVVNKFSPVKYRNYTTIYIGDSEQASFMGSSNDIMQGFGLFSGQNNIDNEIEILQSFTLVKNVIKDLDLKTSYLTFKNSTFSSVLFNTPFCKKKEIYNYAPIRVVIDQSVPQAIYLNFRVILLNENEFYLETSGKDIRLYNFIDDNVVSMVSSVSYKGRFKFGDEIKTRYFSFRVIKQDNFDVNFTKENVLYFYFNDLNILTAQCMKNLEAASTSQTSSLIRINFKGRNPQMVTNFLNSLTSLYLERNIERKNRIALSTVNFIDSQISNIADSLSSAEFRLKSFRSTHNVMDLSFQGQQIVEKMNDLETEKENLNTQRQYYSYLKNYLNDSREVTKLVAPPSSMKVSDPILTELISQLLTLSSRRASILRTSTNEDNLYLADINIQIENLRNTISESVNNTLNTINNSIKEVNYRLATLSSQISQMPKTELQLKGIERKFKLNDNIYTFLLQKRSEAQIARASSMPDYEIIDPARISIAGIVSPKTKLNYLVAIFLALLLPTSVVMARDFLNNKIVDPAEIEKYTDFPIIGKVFHNFRRTNMVVNDHPNSSVTESFRAIRTNFEFFSDGGRKQVLLVTSATSGEGKTFCSINLASVFALNGHRTVLLEFDLRRPKIHNEFGSSNMIGINSFLIEKAIIEDIIMPTHIENLDLISAGPAAPNPAELISSERTGEFIDKLKEMYDYIIIDSAPAGIIAETFVLMKHSDINIFVARMEKTVRDAFVNTSRAFENNKFTNVSVLLNDLNIKRESYKYGYDNKYYTDDRKRGILARLFNNKRKAS
ncbi:MAG: polysaccharide biosynthesis tyrosine autokinase [Bacteroidales bacterium]|nr:MAG: polysaccharide biosynthesis tyrosine autokinase [Bacteroidales bacterium]